MAKGVVMKTYKELGFAPNGLDWIKYPDGACAQLSKFARNSCTDAVFFGSDYSPCTCAEIIAAGGPEPKIGDWLIPVDGNHNPFQITSIVPVNNGWKNLYRPAHISEIPKEAVVEKVEPQAAKFKVGQRVRIISNPGNSGCYPVGHVGYITHNDGGLVRVDKPLPSCGNWYLFQDLELAPSSIAEAKGAAIKFKVNDRVLFDDFPDKTAGRVSMLTGDKKRPYQVRYGKNECNKQVFKEEELCLAPVTAASIKAQEVTTEKLGLYRELGHEDYAKSQLPRNFTFPIFNNLSGQSAIVLKSNWPETAGMMVHDDSQVCFECEKGVISCNQCRFNQKGV